MIQSWIEQGAPVDTNRTNLNTTLTAKKQQRHKITRCSYLNSYFAQGKVRREHAEDKTFSQSDKFVLPSSNVFCFAST